MESNERIMALERLLRKCPDMLSPCSAAKWIRMSKNTIYQLIKENKLIAYKYRGSYIISKADLIEYLADTTDDAPKWSRKFGRNSNE